MIHPHNLADGAGVHTPGAEAPRYEGCESAKAEALAYVDAKALY